MNKRTRTMYRNILTVVLCISLLSITALLCSDSGTMEYILSIVSITVTCILGITTYQQTEANYKLDMMEKTPFFSCQFKGDEIISRASECDLIRNEYSLFENRRFLCVENLAGSTEDALLRITLKNSSPIFIKNVKISCADSPNEEYKDIENYRATLCLENNPSAQLLNTLVTEYCSSSIYGVQPDSELFALIKVKFNSEKINVYLKLDIETVHGYHFEEFIDISAVKVAFTMKSGIIYLVTKSDFSIKG